MEKVIEWWKSDIYKRFIHKKLYYTLLFAHYLQWPRVRVSSCYEENNFEPCLALGINLLVAIEKCLTRLISVREAWHTRWSGFQNIVVNGELRV